MAAQVVDVGLYDTVDSTDYTFVANGSTTISLYQPTVSASKKVTFTWTAYGGSGLTAYEICWGSCETVSSNVTTYEKTLSSGTYTAFVKAKKGSTTLTTSNTRTVNVP